MLHLDGLTERSPGPARAAVEDLTLEVGWIDAADLDGADGRDLGGVGQEPDAVLPVPATLAAAVDLMLSASGSNVVVHEQGSYRGIADRPTVNAAARSVRAPARAAGADAAQAG